MKNVFKHFGIIAVIAIIVFATSTCADPVTNEPGKLTITNLPQGTDYIVGVFNHSGAISGMVQWMSIATQPIAVGTGTASSSMTLYSADATGNVFNQSGSFMIALYTTSMPIVVLYKTGVNFSNGGASIDYNDLVNLLQ